MEVKFKMLNEHSRSAIEKNLVEVSVLINPKQSGGDGIYFTVTVKNNAYNSMSVKNIVNLLSANLYDERGFNIAVPNVALKEFKLNRAQKDTTFVYRSESVVVDQVFINGREESGDVKTQEYVQVPAGAIWKINLILKNVKQVETPEDVQNRSLKSTKSLSPGKYKLKLSSLILPKIKNQSEGFSAAYHTPFIDIEYTK